MYHVACMGKDKNFRPEDQVPTAYAQVRGNVPETFDVFLGSVAPKGYAWIIPKGPDTANVGLGVRAGALKGSVKEHLQKFCEDLGFEILSIGGGWIPMGGPVKTMVDQNVIAVGDAAGLVMPSNGGGISQAMISGCFAAETYLEYKRNGTPLETLSRTNQFVLWTCFEELIEIKKHGLSHVPKRPDHRGTFTNPWPNRWHQARNGM